MMELTQLSTKTYRSPLKHSPNFNPFIHCLLNNYCVRGSEAQLHSPKLKKPQTSGRGDSHTPDCSAVLCASQRAARWQH